MNIQNIQCVSFDLWQTLIINNPTFKQKQINLLGKMLDYYMVEKLEAKLKQAEKYAIKEEKKGLQFGMKDRIKWIAKKLKLEIDLTENWFDEFEKAQSKLFFDNLPNYSEEKIPSILKKLNQKNIKIILISNTGFIEGKVIKKMFTLWKIDKFFENTLFSDELNVAKPNPSIYQTALNQLEITPEKILHIGDNFYTDYLGAKKMGIKSLLYTKNLKKYPKNINNTIDNLTDLLTYFK